MPVIVYIHGGGWIAPFAPSHVNVEFAKLGYFCINIEYRLSNEAIFPAQIIDCKAAIRWLRENDEGLNIDTERIGVWGTSAGGYLAALLGTSGDVIELEGRIGSLETSSRVQAVIDLYGPTDFLQMTEDHLERGSNEYNLLGATGDTIMDDPDAIERANQANPLKYVSTDDPPFLLIHGKLDGSRENPSGVLIPGINPKQSQILYDSLKGNKSEATIILVSVAPHGFIPPEYPSELDCYPSLERLFSIMSDFFDVHIKNEDPERFADIILTIKNVADTSIQYDISHNLNDPSGLKSTKSESVTLNSGDIHESSIQFETLISQHFEPSYVISPSTYEKLVEVERTQIVYKSIIAILFS